MGNFPIQLFRDILTKPFRGGGGAELLVLFERVVAFENGVKVFAGVTAEVFVAVGFI
jgi:hypothetical protein